jgi:3-oxoacyl-[acyl-carrier-protein] synthase II
MKPNDVLLTGIGLVSSLGEGAALHADVLAAGAAEPRVDGERYPPFVIHPLPAIDWANQIPNKGDRRQMETWQRLGTYTAGLALADAGMKGDEALCGSMDMIIAAGGGERDVSVDVSILDASKTRPDLENLLNEKLTTDLRPTLFLAQLSNLLAGNISIVHKVTGSSRTFMGEEGAGVAALDVAAARIRAGQASHVLVGGAFQSEHPDMLLGYELGGYLHRGLHKSVWSRQGSEGGGVISGSGSAFLVLESREHAQGRGRMAYAELAAVASSRARRDDTFGSAIDALLDQVGAPASGGFVVSAASGAHRATSAEAGVLAQRGAAFRGAATLTGHLKEAQFLFAVALAGLAVSRGTAFPPFDAASEAAADARLTEAVATGIGYHYFEGAARLVAAP